MLVGRYYVSTMLNSSSYCEIGDEKAKSDTVYLSNSRVNNCKINVSNLSSQRRLIIKQYRENGFSGKTPIGQKLISTLTILIEMLLRRNCQDVDQVQFWPY